MYAPNTERLINTFLDLVRISSPSWREAGVIDYIVGFAKSLGIEYRLFPCGESHNLVLSVPGTVDRPPFLLSAHMDTVVPCERVVPVVQGAKIASDGTTILGSDDKSAIAMFLEALRVIREQNIPHAPFEIVFSCAEELGLLGIKGFDMAHLKARRGFVFDSGGPVGLVITRAPYHLKGEIAVRGKAAHAGMEPEKGISAIRVLSEIITRLPNGRLNAGTTMNVGTIAGGRETNIVAEDASCRLEIRSMDNPTLKKYEKLVKETAGSVAAKYGARQKATFHLEYSGFTIRETEPVAKIASGALERIGIKPQFIASGGGSDTNIFNKAGIRTINLSCGMREVHTKKEYITKKDLINGARLVLAIIETA